MLGASSATPQRTLSGRPWLPPPLGGRSPRDGGKVGARSPKNVSRNGFRQDKRWYSAGRGWPVCRAHQRNSARTGFRAKLSPGLVGTGLSGAPTGRSLGQDDLSDRRRHPVPCGRQSGTNCEPQSKPAAGGSLPARWRSPGDKAQHNAPDPCRLGQRLIGFQQPVSTQPLSPPGRHEPPNTVRHSNLIRRSKYDSSTLRDPATDSTPHA
jgi:hypothetical protein